MPLNKSWHDYNESLIERGRVLIDVSFLKSSNKEIKKMNIGKVGAPFQYSDSCVRFLAFLKIVFKIPYRMVQGIVRGLAEYVKIVEEIGADYGRVEIARSATSQSDDLFGPTMNMCSKINSKAPPNGVAIGDGLYKVIVTFSWLSSLEKNCYHFEEIVTLEHEFNNYPLYSLQRNSPIASFSEPDWQPSSTNILLIDDEEDILFTFKEGLASEGYNVEAFVDPMEAFAHFVPLI